MLFSEAPCLRASVSASVARAVDKQSTQRAAPSSDPPSSRARRGPGTRASPATTNASDDTRERQRIGRRRLVQIAAEHARQHRSRRRCRSPARWRPASAPAAAPCAARSLGRAERHPQAELLRALRHRCAITPVMPVMVTSSASAANTVSSIAVSRGVASERIANLVERPDVLDRQIGIDRRGPRRG